MLTIKNLQVKVNRASRLERTVIQDLSLHVKAGEFVQIIGNNGAGKSTLFHALSGHMPLAAGRIEIGGQDISAWPYFKRPALISRVLQDPGLAVMDQMSIEENLSFALLRGRCRTLRLHKTVSRLSFFKDRLEQLGMGLELRWDEPCSHLSGGQRQALSLVMATLIPSKLLLLDEITAALDPKMADLVMKLTAKIVEEQKQTTMMITHNMSHALHYGDRIILLGAGRIIKEYTAEEKAKLTPLDLAAVFEEAAQA
ncbi:MAG: ATP-binding cassette domain-containing protein [Oligoflexales bacterium]|nr:ATP-binding cassette domain-containing protein [Oligoflexales bacterium]